MTTSVDDVMAALIDRVESRYFGKYRGQVTDNDDPDDLGRVRATVPRLLGTEETGWALPAFIYGGASEQGLYAVPDVGAGVWIEFEGGDLSYPIWSGTWYTSDAIPEGAKPAQKVLKTKSGHKVVLDDDAGTLEITDSNGNSLTMDSSTIKVKAGDATKIVIEAQNIEHVENAEHPLVFGDKLLDYLGQLENTYNMHLHPGQMALSFPVTPAPPATPISPATQALLSTRVKTG